jgi:outer membrane lipoprotein-sorting protein
MMQRLLIVLPAVLALGAAPSRGAPPLPIGSANPPRPAPGAGQAPDAREIVSRSHEAFYAAAADMRARVQMVLISKDGRTRERELTMLRKNLENGEQRYYIYFHRPSDVRGTTFMVWKYPQRADDRWIYIPAINLVRRIAADDARSSFVGTDFSYEDISGRDVDADEHRLLREDTLNGRPVYVIESRPVRAADYERKLSWIDQQTDLPLREEYYDVQGALHRVFTSDEIRDIEVGATTIATVVKRTMENVKKGHRTEVTFSEVDYNVGVGDDLFTESSLRRPPRRWIR